MATEDTTTPATTAVAEAPVTEVDKHAAAEALLQDTEKLSEIKLSTSDQATLKKLKELGLYSDEELARLEAGMKVAKVQAASAKGERGEREMTTTFSPLAADVFRARVINGKSLDEVKNQFGTDVSDTNSKVREVAFKLTVVGIKSGTYSKEWIEEQLKTLNTGKERDRKPKKDAVVGGTAAAAGAEAPSANGSAAAIEEPAAAEANPFESSDLENLAESE